MLKAILLSLCLLSITSSGMSQINRDSAYSEGYFAGSRLTAETGVFVPVGRLSKHLSNNLFFGLSLDIPTHSRSGLVGFDFMLFGTGGSGPFLYKGRDTVAFTRIIKKGFIGGIHYTHRSYIGNHYQFDPFIGLGLGAVYTDLKKKNPANENDRYYTLNTINLRAGFAFKRALSKKLRLGLKLQYLYTPFALLNQTIPDGLGSGSLSGSLGLTF